MIFFDIESYLEGTLTGKALQEFENELKTNPQFAAEVNGQKQLIEDLRTIELRKTVTSALRSDNVEPSDKQNSSLLRNSFFVILALLIGSFFIYPYLTSDTPQLEEPTDNKIIAPSTDIDSSESQPQIIEEVKQIQKENEEILFAKNEKDKRKSKKIKPILRSMSDSSQISSTKYEAFGIESFLPLSTTLGVKFDKINSEILNQNNTRAYARLQQLERKEPLNDTIAFLKSYCLLTMNEGEEAINILEGIEAELPQWKNHIEWYRVQGYLIIGDKESAAQILSKIISNQEHTFNDKAKKLYKSLY